MRTYHVMKLAQSWTAFMTLSTLNRFFFLFSSKALHSLLNFELNFERIIPGFICNDVRYAKV